MAKKTGNYYISECAKHDCVIKNGKGDHVKIYPPPGYSGDMHMTIIPTNLHGNGTEHSIIKTLKIWGVLLFIAYWVVQYFVPEIAPFNLLEYLQAI